MVNHLTLAWGYKGTIGHSAQCSNSSCLAVGVMMWDSEAVILGVFSVFSVSVPQVNMGLNGEMGEFLSFLTLQGQEHISI